MFQFTEEQCRAAIREVSRATASSVSCECGCGSNTLVARDARGLVIAPQRSVSPRVLVIVVTSAAGLEECIRAIGDSSGSLATYLRNAWEKGLS